MLSGDQYVGSCICIELDNYAFLSIYYVSADFRQLTVGKDLLEKVFEDKLKLKNIGVYTGKFFA